MARACAYRMATPATLTNSAVAATAQAAFVENLAGSGSAAAPAQSPALVVVSVLLLAAPASLPWKDNSAVLQGAAPFVVRSQAHVLLERFVWRQLFCIVLAEGLSGSGPDLI